MLMFLLIVFRCNTSSVLFLSPSHHMKIPGLACPSWWGGGGGLELRVSHSRLELRVLQPMLLLDRRMRRVHF